jgi:uncharacterized protein (TIGR02268 family)
MAVGRQSLFLIPPRDLRIGEGFEVEVCFAGGEGPRCATLMLVGHPVFSYRQVDVFRSSRPPASYQQEVMEAKAEARQYREELRQCRAERDAPEGLTGGLVSGLIGEHGVARKNLEQEVLERPDNAARVTNMASYRAKGRIAVKVRLVDDGARVWAATRAVLRGPTGQPHQPLPLWSPKPLAPGGWSGRQKGYLVVEWLLSGGEQALGAYTFTLWDTEGREVIIDNVTFPSLSE